MSLLDDLVGRGAFGETWPDIQREAHLRVAQAKATGELVSQPCEVCGATYRVQGHHDDYRLPLSVRWLCQIHHRQHHAAFSKAHPCRRVLRKAATLGGQAVFSLGLALNPSPDWNANVVAAILEDAALRIEDAAHFARLGLEMAEREATHVAA